jgi:hypothetical protein
MWMKVIELKLEVMKEKDATEINSYEVRGKDGGDWGNRWLG